MRNIRKSVQQLSILSQIILQFRMSFTQIFADNLTQVLKEINKMNLTQVYNSAITEILINSQQYGVENKLNKFIDKIGVNRCQRLCLEIKFLLTQKATCQVANQETWQFQLEFSHIFNNKVQQKEEKLSLSEEALIQAIKFVTNNLRCFRLFPFDNTNKHIKNKYRLQKEITISQNFYNVGLNNHESMANHSVCLSEKIVLKSSYFYNNSKNQEFLKQFLKQKYLQNLYQSKQGQKRYSSTSTKSTKGLSVYQHYDSDLDITILSNSDNGQEDFQQIFISGANQIEDDQQFQLLIEQTEDNDQKFLKCNLQIFRQLDILGRECGLLY